MNRRPFMVLRFRDPLVPGRFLRRLNRFAALVEMEGTALRVHIRNSGRLTELLIRGRPVWLEPSRTPSRRTRFTLALVRLNSGYVSADAHPPNALVAEALRRAAREGVDVLAKRCRVTRRGVAPDAPVPVRWPRSLPKGSERR